MELNALMLSRIPLAVSATAALLFRAIKRARGRGITPSLFAIGPFLLGFL